MTTWKDVEDAVPDVAGRVKKIFDTHTHRTTTPGSCYVPRSRRSYSSG